MNHIQVKTHTKYQQEKTFDSVNGQPLVLKAEKGVNYELLNTQTQVAPQNIITQRQGDDLIIMLDENEHALGDPNEMGADVILQGYYGEAKGAEGETQAVGIIMGLHENGHYYAYIPESAQEDDAISVLADKMSAPQAIGGQEIAQGFIPWWVWLSALPLGLGAIALARHKSHDKDEHKRTNHKPTIQSEEEHFSTEEKSQDAQEHHFTVKAEDGLHGIKINGELIRAEKLLNIKNTPPRGI